jgi:hypothetical protein
LHLSKELVKIKGKRKSAFSTSRHRDQSNLYYIKKIKQLEEKRVVKINNLINDIKNTSVRECKYDHAI